MAELLKMYVATLYDITSSHRSGFTFIHGAQPDISISVEFTNGIDEDIKESTGTICIYIIGKPKKVLDKFRGQVDRCLSIKGDVSIESRLFVV